MSTGRGVPQSGSGWDEEWARFKSLYEKWLDHWLNHFFDLTVLGSGIRRSWTLALGAGFVAAGFILHALLYYIPILAPLRPFVFAGLPLFFILTVIRLILILFIPTFFAITMAGNYLSDVFELKDPSVAWDYINGLALGEASYVLHIREGKVAEDSLNSPVLLIGGPGIVIAEFDSAALFEKPDGTPHVIGLASTAPDVGGRPNIVLDGFERLREPIINLRDQYIGNPSGQPMTVVSRSLDGIPVSATDVRGMFSVPRQKSGNVTVSSMQAPYPFDPKDIESLVYRQAVPVLTEGPFASGQPGQWTASMQGLIRSSLAEFMSQHKLGEFLSGIGTVESDLAEFREDTIISTTLRYSNDLPDSTGQTSQPARFHSRTELIERFMKPSNGFPQRARDRGLELHWVGLGTWKMPDEVSDQRVTQQHLDAWHLNIQNAERSTPEWGEKVSGDAFHQEKLRLMQAVPLEAHQKNQAKYSEKDVLLECLLQNYWEQLGDALEIYYQSGNPPPELAILEMAVMRIERLLQVPRVHMIGGGTMSKIQRRPESAMSEDAPPAPGSRYEAEQYRFLLGKLDGKYKVAEGMIANEARRHPELDRPELIRRIVERFERNHR